MEETDTWIGSGWSLLARCVTERMELAGRKTTLGIQSCVYQYVLDTHIGHGCRVEG
jgi:hypothetical protein